MPCQLGILDLGDATPRPVREDLTIVIPTLGRPILQACLRSIIAGSLWPAQITVVDQSSDPSIEVWLTPLQSLGIRALHLPSRQQGRASALNRGLERVRTRFVAVTDDDCFVDRDWLRNMAAWLVKNPEAIISGRVEPAGDQAVVAVVTSQSPATYYRPRLRFDAMSGGNMGTSMAVIRRVGFFDEDPRLRLAEDGEWAYRALRSGVPIVYAPEVSVRHYGWRDERQRTATYRAYARSHGAFYGKRLRKGDYFIALRATIHHLRALRRWLRGLVTGNQEQRVIGFAYLTGLLPGIVVGLGREKRS
jgi:GT2 family glycosyltransferase